MEDGMDFLFANVSGPPTPGRWNGVQWLAAALQEAAVQGTARRS
jgi:hypothetical protein